MESRPLQETDPVFHLSPRTLQEMAATQCAFDCWRNVIVMKNYDSEKICGDKRYWERSSLTISCAEIAPFPVAVRSLINHKIRLIGRELRIWCNDLFFIKLSPGVIVNCVVLNSGGDICYKRTAKNLLTANPAALGLKDQFEIACRYSLEEDVERFWRRWWRKFFLLAQVSDICEVMKVCFNNSDDIIQFKINSMLGYDELNGIFKEFVKGGLFDEFTEYLKFCFSDEKLVREARKNLVFEQFEDQITARCESDSILCKFLQFFLDSVSSSDLAELLNWEFQDKEANLLFMCMLYDITGRLRIFTKALRCFEFPDQRLTELKRFFFERCQYVLMSGDFNSFFVRDWEEFLLWCASSPENVTRLRDSIAIDDLFENFLITMHKTYCVVSGNISDVKYRFYRENVFYSIDCLLRWYFGGKDRTVSYSIISKAVREFKSGKLKNYENSETIKMLLNVENDKILRDVLLWFFDDDRRELKNFLVHFDNENYVLYELRDTILKNRRNS